MVGQRQNREDMIELLHHDHYTCEELAELLDMDLHYLQHEALTGHLRAVIVDHHIIGISRGAVVDWLRTRQMPVG